MAATRQARVQSRFMPPTTAAYSSSIAAAAAAAAAAGTNLDPQTGSICLTHRGKVLSEVASSLKGNRKKPEEKRRAAARGRGEEEEG